MAGSTVSLRAVGSELASVTLTVSTMVLLMASPSDTCGARSDSRSTCEARDARSPKTPVPTATDPVSEHARVPEMASTSAGT